MSEQQIGAYDQQMVREGLAKLSTRALRRGMRAFEHPPRLSYGRIKGDPCGCFSSAAFDADDPMDSRLAYMPMVRAVGRDAESAFSLAYELYTAWFKGECIRELVERGVAPESAPTPRVAVPA